MLRFLTKVQMTVTTESGGRQMLSQLKLVHTLMSPYPMKDIHKMQKRLMVVGL